MHREATVTGSQFGVVSEQCELVSDYQHWQYVRLQGGRAISESSGTVQLEILSAVEGAFLIEVVVH